MLFTMSVYSFAEDNNATEIERIEKHNIKVNTKKLANYLGLSQDQEEVVEVIEDEFSNDLMFAAVECSKESHNKVMNNLIEKNIKNMGYILNKEQYRKYLTVLNATISNRGLKF
jgi:hypothetical protein